MSPDAPVHATLVAHFHAGTWAGALLEGPSGVGKSDLAIRLLGRGWRLVADDRVVLWASGARLFGRSPDVLKGLIEFRGQGVREAPVLPLAEIVLVVSCRLTSEDLERVPPPATRTLCGVARPLVAVAAREASAPDRLTAALRLNVV